jgi:hypothetical protein
MIMSRTNPYVKTAWVDEETEINADNLNNLEQGVYGAHSAIIAAEDSLAEALSNLLEENTVDTAKKAVSDANGDPIDATYATKAYVNNANSGNVKYNDVINSLTDSSTTKPLSAAQGKELKSKIDELYAFLDTATEDFDTTINRVQDVFAFLDSVNDNQTLLDLLDTKMSFTSLVKDLVTNDDDLPLAASQGYLLQQQVNEKNDKPFNVTPSDLQNLTSYTNGAYTVTLSDALVSTIIDFKRSLNIDWSSFRSTILENITVARSVLVPTNIDIVNNTNRYFYNAVGYNKNVTIAFFYKDNGWNLLLSFEELPTNYSVDSAIAEALDRFLRSSRFEEKVRSIIADVYADVSEVEY